MNKPSAFTVLFASAAVCVATALGTTGSPAPADDRQGKPGPGVKWEYKFIRGQSEAEFNQLGDEGWELAGARTSSGGAVVNFIFKRPKR